MKALRKMAFLGSKHAIRSTPSPTTRLVRHVSLEERIRRLADSLQLSTDNTGFTGRRKMPQEVRQLNWRKHRKVEATLPPVAHPDVPEVELAATYADARDRMKMHREAEYKKWKASQQSSNAQPPANKVEPATEEQGA